MVTVVCKIEQCPYRSKNGFCRNRVLLINLNGSCGHIYDKNGQIKSNWQEPIDERFMDGYIPAEKEIKTIEERKEK